MAEATKEAGNKDLRPLQLLTLAASGASSSQPMAHLPAAGRAMECHHHSSTRPRLLHLRQDLRQAMPRQVATPGAGVLVLALCLHHHLLADQEEFLPVETLIGVLATVAGPKDPHPLRVQSRTLASTCRA